MYTNVATDGSSCSKENTLYMLLMVHYTVYDEPFSWGKQITPSFLVTLCKANRTCFLCVSKLYLGGYSLWNIQTLQCRLELRMSSSRITLYVEYVNDDVTDFATKKRGEIEWYIVIIDNV